MSPESTIQCGEGREAELLEINFDNRIRDYVSSVWLIITSTVVSLHLLSHHVPCYSLDRYEKTNLKLFQKLNQILWNEIFQEGNNKRCKFTSIQLPTGLIIYLLNILFTNNFLRSVSESFYSKCNAMHSRDLLLRYKIGGFIICKQIKFIFSI